MSTPTTAVSSPQPTKPVVLDIPTIYIIGSGVTKKFPQNFIKLSKMVQQKVLEAPKSNPRLNIYLSLNNLELEFVMTFLEKLQSIIRGSNNSNSGAPVGYQYSNEQYRWLKSFKLEKPVKHELYQTLSLKAQGSLLPKFILAADTFEIIDNYLIRAMRNNIESYLSSCPSQVEASSYFGFASQEDQFSDLDLEKIDREKQFGIYNLRDLAAEQSILYNSYADRKAFDEAMAKLAKNKENSNIKNNNNKNNNKIKNNNNNNNIQDDNNDDQIDNQDFEQDDDPKILFDIVDEVLPRRPEVPMHDSKRCQKSDCHVEFTTLNRKHHCRNCGKIFCSKCSSSYVENSELPKLMFYNHYDWFSQERRVCLSCFETIRLPVECRDTIRALKLLGLKFNCLRKFSCVCPLWRRASVLYLSEVRFIQYKFPSHSFSGFEKRVLWRNRESFTGHSIWLLKLLSSIDYNEISLEKSKKVLNCLDPHAKKNCNCYLLMCSSGCKISISPLNIVPLLDKNVKSLEIREFAVETLKKLDSVLCILPQLVFLLRYEPIDHQILLDHLISLAIEDKEIAYSLLWELKNNQKSVEYANRYEQIRFKIISALALKDQDSINSFSNGFEMVHILQQHPVSDTPNKEHLSKLKSLEQSNLIFPVNPSYRIKRFNIDTAESINSATKPITLTCDCKHSEIDNYKTFKLMLKKDDLRNDQVIMNIIKIMDKMVMDKMGPDFPRAVTYRVQPTGDDFGFIEMVENSQTLAKIYEKHGRLLGSFNDDLMWVKAKVFRQSLATWIVFTHLLGVGDRHHGNVMVKDDGKLFHIDYGFILGKEPKPLYNNFIRNDQNFEDFYFQCQDRKQEFQNTCVELFLHLRRESNFFLYHLLFLTRFEPMLNNRFNEKYIEEEVASRFVPGLSDKEASEYFLYIIEQNTFRPFVDFFNKNRNVLQNVKETISSSYGYVQDYLSYIPKLWGPAQPQYIDQQQQQQQQQQSDPTFHDLGEDF